MKIEIGNQKVAVLGDPHMGKKFQNGVPLHRRGDREKLQWADFEASLGDVADCSVHVCLGDLFDQWAVPFEAIYRAAIAYKKAAAANPGVEYVVLRGNHDASRIVERVSAFTLFAELARGSGVRVVTSYAVSGNLVFFGWDPVLTAEQMVSAFLEEYRERLDLLPEGTELVAFVHNDVVAIGETSNLLPAKTLLDAGFSLAITGHDHTRRELIMDGLAVQVVGSMQPYSFAEDPDGDLYITTTLAEVEADPAYFVNKCVRIVLKDGESVTTPIDCLQLRIVTEQDPTVNEDEATEVGFSEFNFQKLFEEVFEEKGVNAAMREIAQQRFEAERLKE